MLPIQSDCQHTSQPAAVAENGANARCSRTVFGIFLKAGHFSTLVPMAGVIGRLASRITVPHWRTQRFPTAAAAAEFGVAGVVLATSFAVGELVDEGDVDSTVRNTRLGIRINMQTVAD